MEEIIRQIKNQQEINFVKNKARIVHAVKDSLQIRLFNLLLYIHKIDFLLVLNLPNNFFHI